MALGTAIKKQASAYLEREKIKTIDGVDLLRLSFIDKEETEGELLEEDTWQCFCCDGGIALKCVRAFFKAKVTENERRKTATRLARKDPKAFEETKAPNASSVLQRRLSLLRGVKRACQVTEEGNGEDKNGTPKKKKTEPESEGPDAKPGDLLEHVFEWKQESGQDVRAVFRITQDAGVVCPAEGCPSHT